MTEPLPSLVPLLRLWLLSQLSQQLQAGTTVSQAVTLEVTIPLSNASQRPKQGDKDLCSQNKPKSELKQWSGLAER